MGGTGGSDERFEHPGPEQGRCFSEWGRLPFMSKWCGSEFTPWEPGASVAPARVEAPPRRHSKPHVGRGDDDTYTKLVMNGGRAAGLSVADIVAAVTRTAGLDGEAVRDVQLLERFAFLAVPSQDADRVVDALQGESLHGRQVSLQRVEA